MKRTLRVVIVGGGIGGLTLAQGLRKHGIEPAVFERTTVRADYVQGFRLAIRDRGLQSLQHCLPEHLYTAVIDTAGQAPAHQLQCNERLEPITPDSDHYRPPRTGDANRLLSLSRITLRQILLDGLGEVVRHGVVFSGYDVHPDGSLTAHFEDGTSIDCDVLIGADGSHSRVRAQLLPDATSYDTNVRRLAGKIPLRTTEAQGILRIFSDHGVSVRPTGGHHLMITSHRVDPQSYRKYGLIGANDPTHVGLEGFHFDNTTSYIWWNTAHWRGEFAEDDRLFAMSAGDVLELALSKWRGYHPELLKLLGQTDPSTLSPLRVRTSVPPQPWSTRQVTVLGDAIHAMTYFCALGGNSAMVDAGLLAVQLTAVQAGEKPLLQGLHDYEQSMRAHGFAAVRNSLESMMKSLGPRPTWLG